MNLIKIISMMIVATVVVFMGCVEPASVSPSSEFGTPPLTESVDTTLAETSKSPEILSHASYFERDNFKVVGEIQNTLPYNIQSVKVVATFYDEQNDVIGTAFTFTSIAGLDILKPGQKSPFVLSSYPDKLDPSKYKLQVSYMRTSEESFKGLEIISHNSKVERGYYEIVGEVQNNGERETQSVKVIVTYYDEDDKVIGTAFTFTSITGIDTIYVGNSAPFEISSYPMTLNPSCYELQVQGR